MAKKLNRKNSSKATKKKVVTKKVTGAKPKKKASKKVEKKKVGTSSKKTKATVKPKAKPAKKIKKVKNGSMVLPKDQLSMNIAMEESWPKDRDIVWNPQRFKYLNQAKSETCVFCAAANFGVAFDSLVLFKNQYVQVVLNKYPYLTGHIMVMPVRHIDELDKLDAKEYVEIMLMLRTANSILQKVYRSEGTNIGINLGKAAGAGIPGHLHWHIIPRWIGDTNFFPVLANTKVISESLDVTYEKLRPHFINAQAAGVPGSGEWKQVEFKLEE